MLVLDTARVDPADRAEAFQSAVSHNCTTSAALFEDASAVRAQMHAFDLGPAKVLTIEASGTTLRRTLRMARAMNDCPIALALPVRTSNRLVRDRDDRFFGARDLILVDLSAPYLYRWGDDGASYALHVDHDHLGLPMDTVRAAVPELRRSPLYPLVRDHVERVLVGAADVAASGAAVEVGTASVELMRAIIVSAAGDARRTTDAMHATLLVRVQEYVRRHVRDPELDPRRVAAAHGVSLRSLYTLYESTETTLEQSIIELRLQGARADLGTPALQHRSIAAVAASWGFASPSHFSTRFRQAYGETPRQWRAARTPARTGPAAAPATAHTA